MLFGDPGDDPDLAGLDLDEGGVGGERSRRGEEGAGEGESAMSQGRGHVVFFLGSGAGRGGDHARVPCYSKGELGTKVKRLNCT